MKATRTIISAVLVLTLLTGVALADWDPGDGHKMHFPQLPDPNGWDVKFGPFSHSAANDGIKILADDWQCSETGPVSDIHFWFSSKGDALTPDTGMIQNIHVSIWSNDPGDPGAVPSRPKDPLWWGDSENGDFTVRSPRGPFTGQQAWYDPNLPFDTGFNPILDDHQNYWQINIFDIPEPFQQQRGQVYWLAVYMVTRPIDPNTTEPPIELGWKTADTRLYPDQYTGKHFMDDAFYGHFIPDPAQPAVEWIGPLEDLTEPDAPRSIDLAFVITPEPATLTVLALGLISTMPLLRRSRS